jgi:hypothetical protein
VKGLPNSIFSAVVLKQALHGNWTPRLWHNTFSMCHWILECMELWLPLLHGMVLSQKGSDKRYSMTCINHQYLSLGRKGWSNSSVSVTE